MAKFYGKIGFDTTEETSPGVWRQTIVERTYRGDLNKTYSKWDGADKLNDDINITNNISIVADPFAFENFAHIRYVEFMGEKWKVTSIDASYPRLTLSVGGLYNASET